jgi:Putative DNA-binding HTH domain
VGSPEVSFIGARISAMSSNDERFVMPLYSAAEAARHLNIPTSTFRTWAHGYRNSPRGRRPVVGDPIVTTVPLDSGASIPFVGLAEGYVLAAIRRAGVPLQRIRPALDRLRVELGIEHVLASRKLFTDGAEVLYDYAEHEGDTPEARSARELVVVRNDQRVFNEIVDSYLQRIDFHDDPWARVIHLPKYRQADVVVDLTRSFGAPIFAHGGVRLETVLAAFKRGAGTVPAWVLRNYAFRSATSSALSHGPRSSGDRAEIRLPSTTVASSTQSTPAFSMSSRIALKLVARRPLSIFAEIGTQPAWQMKAIGLPSVSNAFTRSSTRCDRRSVSGANPPGMTSASYSSSETSSMVA